MWSSQQWIWEQTAECNIIWESDETPVGPDSQEKDGWPSQGEIGHNSAPKTCLVTEEEEPQDEIDANPQERATCQSTPKTCLVTEDEEAQDEIDASP